MSALKVSRCISRQWHAHPFLNIQHTYFLKVTVFSLGCLAPLITRLTIRLSITHLNKAHYTQLNPTLWKCQLSSMLLIIDKAKPYEVHVHRGAGIHPPTMVCKQFHLYGMLHTLCPACINSLLRTSKFRCRLFWFFFQTLSFQRKSIASLRNNDQFF